MRNLTWKSAWPWLRLVLGLGIVVALVMHVGSRSVLDGLRAIDAGEVAAALGIGLVTTVLCAWRWSFVARRLGLRLPMGQAVADYYRSLFLNAVLPAGVLGDVHRAVRHGRQEGDVGRGVRAVVLERAAGQAVIIAAAVAVLVTLPSAGPARDIVLIVLGVVALGVVGLLAARRRVAPDSRWGRTLDDVRVGLLARDAWPGVALLSAAALAGHIALFIIAAHAAGATVPAAQLVPLVVLSLLAMGLPVSIGGFGPREGVTALSFGAAGLGSAQGLTAAVIYGVLGLVASLPGAWMLVRRSPALHRQGVTT
ncbi:lysylphosphatidylglycerol synthase transmembrane domain-containing protein [Actinophytocola sp.]|uniref:lysylphosphatidylglycerol synthase transmembrane domain-containing protein n=1 Tax=Actinophytocola sp. TaxID=1872138 RepID=UPI002D808A51|nr:lysylphosphatidylglycerol synthase transmembrane domain-containing protein [Actinophytocola sp.]HET9142374.1 lysylphosphatidylglycerol synthase transmembrane domain-containing protein [Actinophytocola sp.]HEU5109088.1 lysylphosphatidylglycerol synthase transmembrane domain-containing protein [Micromonosporaceae bacterium]